MRVDFFRSDDPDRAVASVRYLDGALEIGAGDDRTKDAMGRIFHRSPLAVDDPSLRSAGTFGPAVVQPGSLAWFLAASRARAETEGLTARVVPEEELAMGWDPAGAYRTFADAVVRRVRIGGPSRTPEPEAGETRPEGERGPSATGTEAARPAPRPSAAGASEADRKGAAGPPA